MSVATMITNANNAGNGKMSESIQNLAINNQQLKEELKIKDRLIQTLIQTEEAVGETARLLDDNNTRPKKFSALTMKLKSELDLCFKILAQRDIEINQMKKNVKQLAFNQCNEERILYMNECMKL